MVEVLNSNIELVVLDYGGVIIDLYPERTLEELEKLGLREPEKLYHTQYQAELFNLFDKGQISENDFFIRLLSYFKNKPKISELEQAWNAMLGTINYKKISFINELRTRVPVCLLSNTNETHLRYISNFILPASNCPPPEQWLDKVYYSCEVGMRKPDREIFLKVMQEWNLPGEHILFIDDTEMHCAGARLQKWNAFKVERNQPWEFEIRKCLNMI